MKCQENKEKFQMEWSVKGLTEITFEQRPQGNEEASQPVASGGTTWAGEGRSRGGKT